MHSLETSQFDHVTPVHVTFGGGSTGTFANAIKLARPEDDVYGVVATSDNAGFTDIIANMSFPESPRERLVASGDVRRSIAAGCPSPAAIDIAEAKFGTDSRPVDVARRGLDLLDALQGHNDSRITQKRAIQILGGAAELSSYVNRNRGDYHLFGANLGHLIMTHLTLEHGDVDTAAQEAQALMGSRTIIMPNVIEPTDLIRTSGTSSRRATEFGEEFIDYNAPVYNENVRVSLTPNVAANPRLREIVPYANSITFIPGSNYTSRLASMVAGGQPEMIAEAQRNGAELVYVGNLLTNQYEGLSNDGEAQLRVIEDHLPRGTRFDTLIFNNKIAGLPRDRAITLNNVAEMKGRGYKVILGDYVGHANRRQANDLVSVRSDILHNFPAIGEEYVRNKIGERALTMA